MKGVSVRWLIGPAEEAANFALRYFEIEPGGWSSVDHHDHDHYFDGTLLDAMVNTVTVTGGADGIDGEAGYLIGLQDVFFKNPFMQ